MRRLIILLFVIPLLLSCSETENQDEKSFSVVAVDFPSYDAARAILGSDDNLVMLLPPGTESHSYDPTPRDMILLSESDLVVYTGGPSDEWVVSILSSLDEKPASFALTEHVRLLAEEAKDGMEHVEDDHDHIDHGIDEHVWTSIPNEIAIIGNLADVLSEADSSRRELFQANAAAYIDSLEALDSEIRDIVSSSRLDTLIFASRFPLLYFAREYGVEYYAAFPGCAEETEPSARTIAFLIDKAKELGTRYVLNIELSSSLIARTIAEEAGCGVLVFNSMHNITRTDFMNGETYITLMERNAEVLREALS